MITRHDSGSLVWYDVLSPDTDEIRTLAEECTLPPEYLTDLTSVTPNVTTTASKNAVKMVLDFPFVKRTDLTRPHQVKFIATKKALVTIRFEDIQSIDNFASDFEVHTLLHKKDRLTGGHLLISLLLLMYRGLDDKLDYLTERLAVIDNEIFTGHEREMVKEIAEIGRRLVMFRQAVEAQGSALGMLYSALPNIFKTLAQEQVVILNEQYMHINRRLARTTLALQELRETNNSLITTKQNEIMKTLTIMAFVTFPLSLVSSIFGMNTIATPIIGTPGDFWIILAFMLTGFVSFFIFFWYKKWL